MLSSVNLRSSLSQNKIDFLDGRRTTCVRESFPNLQSPVTNSLCLQVLSYLSSDGGLNRENSL